MMAKSSASSRKLHHHPPPPAPAAKRRGRPPRLLPQEQRVRSEQQPPRRQLRPRRSRRPILDDFDGLSSSAGSSDEEELKERGGRRKLRLVVKLSSQSPAVPPPPSRRSSLSSSEASSYLEEDEDDEEEEREMEAEVNEEEEDEEEEQIKPLKKRRMDARGWEDRPVAGSRHQQDWRSDGIRRGRRSSAGTMGTNPMAVQRTPLPRRETLEAILDKLQKKDTYGAFAHPVDPTELPDYHDVIDNPMDFSTVRSKLSRNLYRSFEQFKDDVFLICNNAMQYNAPDTIYFRQANSMQELAKKKFQELKDAGLPIRKEFKHERNIRPDSPLKEPKEKPVRRDEQETLGYRTSPSPSPTPPVFTDDVCVQTSAPQAISKDPSPVHANGYHESRASSCDTKQDKADESSAMDSPLKPTCKPIEVDVNRRVTYTTFEESHSPALHDPIFGAFAEEPKCLVAVGQNVEHAYARSLARFSALLGTGGWKIASRHIKQALPEQVNFGRGWVGEFEPPLSSTIIPVDNLLQNRVPLQPMPPGQMQPKPTKEVKTSRATENGVRKAIALESEGRKAVRTVAVQPSVDDDSVDVKPKIVGVTHGTSLATHDQRLRQDSLSASGTAGQGSDYKRGERSSSSCSSQAADAAHTRSDSPWGVHPRMPDSALLAKRSVHPESFSKPSERLAAQTKSAQSAPTWIYRGGSNDGMAVANTHKIVPGNNMGFITKLDPSNGGGTNTNAHGLHGANDHTTHARGQHGSNDHKTHARGQHGSNDHKTHVRSGASLPMQMDNPHKGVTDATTPPRQLFSPFPPNLRESTPVASTSSQSWISFGAPTEANSVNGGMGFLNSSGWTNAFSSFGNSDDPKKQAALQFFVHPTQAVRPEHPININGPVTFPQLSMTDMAGSHCRPQWQGLVPHVQTKPRKEPLRPDLNIGFPSPGSPSSTRQSSSINLDTQQPDLALQL